MKPRCGARGWGGGRGVHDTEVCGVRGERWCEGCSGGGGGVREENLSTNTANSVRRSFMAGS